MLALLKRKQTFGYWLIRRLHVSQLQAAHDCDLLHAKNFASARNATERTLRGMRLHSGIELAPSFVPKCFS
jgi:hypothetical protein